MALTAAQIISLACQDAKCPNFTTQALNFMNMELGDLCRSYDFELAAKTFYFNFNPGLSALMGNSIYGSGPYALPSDFLRVKDDKSVFWTLNGVVYPLIPIDLSEFDMAVQQAGIQSYPWWFATDMSIGDQNDQGLTTPSAYVYAAPSGAYPCTVRYFAQMADITNTATVPWFPHQGYLRRKVAAMLMGLADDTREMSWLDRAETELRNYLQLKDNKTDRVQSIRLDRRRFGSNYSKLPNTKTIGW